jgi:dihydroxyacetone kinase
LGYDPDYVRRAIQVLVANAGVVSVKDIAGQLATFQNKNPDCNAAGMRAELMFFLRDIAVADGFLDEREKLALDAVAAVMAETSKSLINQVQKSASRTPSATTEAVSGLATKVASIDIGRLNPFGKSGANTGEDKA